MFDTWYQTITRVVSHTLLPHYHAVTIFSKYYNWEKNFKIGYIFLTSFMKSSYLIRLLWFLLFILLLSYTSRFYHFYLFFLKLCFVPVVSTLLFPFSPVPLLFQFSFSFIFVLGGRLLTSSFFSLFIDTFLSLL